MKNPIETGSGRPVGIGPVIAGHEDGQPVYYVDLAYPSGKTNRLTWRKAGRKFDRPAKLAAYRERINLARDLRPHGVVLTHDQDSFMGLVSLLTQGNRKAHAA